MENLKKNFILSKWITKFETGIVIILVVLMAIVISASTIELGIFIFKLLANPPYFMINISDLLEIFGFFLLVLIGIELLETIKSYLMKNEIRVEVVLIVGIIAIARKIIILDFKDMTFSKIMAVSLLLLSLGVTYLIIKYIDNNKKFKKYLISNNSKNVQ